MKKLTLLLTVLLLISSCALTTRELGTAHRAPGEGETQYVRSPIESPVYAADTPQVMPARYRIGVLLPMTGKSAHIGKSIADAAQLAVDESGRTDFQIMIFDTGDTAEMAAQAADQAIAAKVNIILGPIFSDKVNKVAEKARAADLKVIAFSNNKAVAGRNVYILGLIPDQQVARVLKYAYDRGISGFSGLMPNNVFGNQVAELEERQVQYYGGEIRKISLIAGGDYMAATKEVADVYKAKSLVPDRKSEGVLIPEGSAKAMQMAGALKKNGIGNMRLLGTALWDKEDTITNRGLNGAWFASTPYENSDLFIGRFISKYKYKPEDIAGLGYDAVTLSIAVADDGFSDSSIRRSRGFDGVKGVYRFDGSNVNLRGYAIYEIRDGAAHVADPSPDHF